MLIELIVAASMVLLTVATHGVGLYALERLLRLETHEDAMAHRRALSPRAMAGTLMVVLILFLLHGIEIWAYAMLYLALDALPSVREAVYFSTITYATIGYDDEGFDRAWQLVAAIEGMNGVILLGWSTAFFVTVVARMERR